MKILLISDTHGYLDPRLKKHIEACDEVWHAGDVGPAQVLDEIKKKKPVRAVVGNIDGQDIRIEYPELLEFTCEGLRVLMTHIGGFPGRYPARISSLLAQKRPGLF